VKTRPFAIVAQCVIILSFITEGRPAFGEETNKPASGGSFQIEYNFSNPGARSLALGGAFVGLADDATAAYANPAGLVKLSRPEVSAEGRKWSFTNAYPNSGHAFGKPLDLGVDDTRGIRTATDGDSTRGLSFVSFVYPKGKWSVAFYRQELANFEANVRTGGPFFDLIEGGEEFVVRLFPSQTSAKLDIVNYGLSGALRITDKLSFGLGANYYDFSYDSVTRRYGFKDVGTAQGGFFGPPDFSDSNEVNRVVDTGEDNDLKVTVGILWAVTESWSLGAVYRQGPTFERQEINSGTGSSQVTESRGSFEVPDVIAVGTAFKPTDQITMTVDFNRIRYSAIKFNSPVRIDDADELHFGIEYVIIGSKMPVSLRTGAWLDPDHQPSYRPLVDETIDSRSLAVQYPRGKDQWHTSAGVGLVFGEKFQFDAAADFSDRVDTLSLSAVYRF